MKITFTSIPKTKLMELIRPFLNERCPVEPGEEPDFSDRCEILGIEGVDVEDESDIQFKIIQ